VKVLTLSPGRHWLEASAADAARVSLEFEFETVPSATPAALMLGASADGLRLAIEQSGDGSHWELLQASESGGGPRRRVVGFGPYRTGSRLRVTLLRETAARADERLRIEEIGFFASEAGLARDRRAFLRDVPDRRAYHGLLARACLWLAVLGVAVATQLPRNGRSWLVASFVFALTLAASVLTLYVVHNPYWYRARDLRVLLASGPLQDGVGANLNYGMYLGSRLLAGEGLTFGPRWVPWERMPGYGFFGALAGLVSGFSTDLFTIGLASIKLHVLFFAAANAGYAAAALRVMRPWAALATASVVCFMPNQLANTQADSIMVPTYLLTAAGLCLYLERERTDSNPPLRHHLLVHLAFALWFVTRPEALVGWAAVSLILYRRRLRYLTLPAGLFLAIGLSWGAYKQQYTGEFSMTTNTVGDNAWIGLWQVPSKFRWQTKDESYFEWAERVGVPATSKRASERALREVAAFVASYPVYATHLALFRFLELVDVNLLNGTLSYPHVFYESLRGPGLWSMLGVVTACLLLPHEARRTLLLGWPLLFNLPLFLLFFSDGMRHVAPCTAALFVGSLPPLLEGGFYRALLRRRGRALAIATVFTVAWPLAHWADRALLASDALRYATPFLDPAPFAWYLR
jgi:hypothetical protein